MKCLSQKRIMAWALLICFVALFLLSGVFILTHAGHEHDRNGVGGVCATCVQIRNAENILKQFAAVVTGGFVVLAGLHAFACINGSFLNISLLTLVTSKIRMNN